MEQYSNTAKGRGKFLYFRSLIPNSSQYVHCQIFFGVTDFFGTRQQNFAGAGLLLAQLLPQKPRQQNSRCASKISDVPAKSLTLITLTCHIKKVTIICQCIPGHHLPFFYLSPFFVLLCPTILGFYFRALHKKASSA